jgi:hypothetical protein
LEFDGLDLGSERWIKQDLTDELWLISWFAIFLLENTRELYRDAIPLRF